jgi:hypothetical protein
MIHDLLFALFGITGDVFVVDGDVSDLEAGIVVAPDVPVDAAEREALNRLARLVSTVSFAGLTPAQLVLGQHYRALERHVATEWSGSGGSLYRQACACGIDELLTDYRCTVLQLEQELLSGELSGGLSSLTYVLRSQLVLLPALHTLTAQYAAGGELLTLLHEKRALCGAPSLAHAFGRLAWHANAAALRQLAAWTLHGSLCDPHGEFFITRLLPEAADESEEAAADEADGGAASWHSTFGLRPSQPLPPWLDIAGAEAALFCGRVVRTLDAPRGRFSHLQAPELLPDKLREKWAARLRDLAGTVSLERDAVEAALGLMRAEAADALWALVGVHAGLTGHLQALRDYLLLGRGDLFSALEEERVEGGAEADPHAAWSAAADRSGVTADPLFAHIQLLPAAPAAGGGWEGLALGYRCEWPLGLVLSPSSLATLSAVSQHLLRQRAAAAALQRIWAPLRRGRPRRGACGALALRARAEALLSAWAAYVHASVAAPAYAQLQLRVKGAGQPGGGGWGEAARAVAGLVAALRGGMFLELPPVVDALAALADNAHALELLVVQALLTGAAAPLDTLQLAQLQESWERAAIGLLAALRGLAGAGGRAPSLRLLLEHLEEGGLVPFPHNNSD